MTKTDDVAPSSTQAPQTDKGPLRTVGPYNAIHMRLWDHVQPERTLCGRFTVYLMTDTPDRVTCEVCRREWDAFNAEEL